LLFQDAMNVILLAFAIASSPVGTEVLRPGDLVTLDIAGTDLHREKRAVEADGAIDLGEYGRLGVASLTVELASLALQQHLSAYLRNTEDVRLQLDTAGRLVVVTGLVRKPGRVVLPAPADLWQALHLAGGPLDAADLRRVMLLRGEERIDVDLRAYLTGAAAAVLPQVRPGDTILVPARAGWSGKAGAPVEPTSLALEGQALVLGAVTRAGAYPRAARFEPLAAIAQAGGALGDADLTAVRVLADGHAYSLDLLAHVRTGKPLPEELVNASGPITLYVPSRDHAGRDRSVRAVHVIGEVTAPGPHAVDGPLALLDALSLAGGPSERADLTRVVLVRRAAGVVISTRYDVGSRMRSGSVPVVLRPGDTLFIPDRGEDPTKLALSVLSNVAVLAGLATLLLGAFGI
jgi:protein involved in polysaccharide export with SLBB domain